jgi:methionine-rich copper-binding protein CopC
MNGKIVVVRDESQKRSKMKRFVLLCVITLWASQATVQAQSERHPISTASIVLSEGRTEISFDEIVSEPFSVELRDLTGKSVYVLRSDRNVAAYSNMELPLENLKKGIYMVLITGESGKTKTLKLQRN